MALRTVLLILCASDFPMSVCWPAVEIYGFAGGNNAGARIADGGYLAFLNNDTVAQPGWLNALRTPFDRDPSVGLTTSRIVYLHDSSIIDSAGDGYLRAGGAERTSQQERTRGSHSGQVLTFCWRCWQGPT